MWKNKKILLGITASIAAYKAVFLLRLLVKEGAEVRVVMTPKAKQFVAPVIFSTFSSHKVYSDFVEDELWENHVSLGAWADIFLIAPLSCNTLAKMANGICDNFLLATYLSAKCPVVVCPAMDEDMLAHPATQKNLLTLSAQDKYIIPPTIGELASGIYGKGRMAEPEDIIIYLKEQMGRGIALQGKKVLITAGATKEFIDPVRFLSNESSGKMGYALAMAFYEQGAEVCVITGAVNVHIPYKNMRLIPVVSASEMYDMVMKEQATADYLVLSAAVADYTPSVYSQEKIKKKEGRISLELQQTTDILAALGKIKRHDQTLVGFALETDNGKEYAQKKLREKNADFMVLNVLTPQNPCFNVEYNQVSLFDKHGEQWEISLQSKLQVARAIVSKMME